MRKLLEAMAEDRRGRCTMRASVAGNLSAMSAQCPRNKQQVGGRPFVLLPTLLASTLRIAREVPIESAPEASSSQLSMSLRHKSLRVGVRATAARYEYEPPWD